MHNPLENTTSMFRQSPQRTATLLRPLRTLPEHTCIKIICQIPLATIIFENS